MDKNTKSGIVISQIAEHGLEKILCRLTAKKVINIVLCFVLQYSSIFSAMSPFSVAFYASVFDKESWLLCFISSFVASAFSGSTAFWKYVPCLVMSSAVFAVFEIFSKSIWVRAVTVSGCFMALCALRFIARGFVAYDVLALILEGLIMASATYVFCVASASISGIKRRSFISEAESICIFGSAAVLVLASGYLSPIAGMNPAAVISVWMIYTMCYAGNKNASLTFAVILGVVGAMQPGATAHTLGTYAFGALLASAFSKYGKTGTVLGFIIANTASSLILSDTAQIVIGIYESIVASLVFMITPRKITDFFALISEKSRCSNLTFHSSADSPNTERFIQMADAFCELSEIYASGTTDRMPGKSFTNSIMRMIPQKACVGCMKRDHCFNEKSGKVTQMMSILKRNPDGHISIASLPEDFKKMCHRSDSFVSAFNSATDIVRAEYKWIVRNIESKKMISRQLRGISEAIKKECLYNMPIRDSSLEEKLAITLDNRGIYAKNISAQRDTNGFFEVDIYFKNISTVKNIKKIISEEIEKLTNTPTDFAGVRNADGNTVLTFCPKGAYSASFGYATRAKSGQNVCGDSFNVIYTDRNKMVMALSDGMGSGKEAQSESKTTINLLEKFLRAGFDCDTSVGLINSSLLLKGEKDSFATIDLCDIDLSGATLSFTKLGSANAYMKCGGNVTVIRGESLPAGILKEAEAEKHMLPIETDTVVILMSDGVADIALRNKEHEGWIEKTLLSLNVTNPQIIAGKLLEVAYSLENRENHDDMTVLAAYISKV